MKKKTIILAIISALFLIWLLFIFAKNKHTVKAPILEKAKANQVILFYGDGCPHCAKVEDYIKKNNIKKIINKEVYHDKANAAELKDKAKECGLNTNSIGVPFLWNGQKCLIGDKKIIDFLQNKSR